MRVIRIEGGAARVGGRELAGPGAPIWIDLAPSDADLRWLGERFGFHPLALEDCANEDQRVKFDQYPGHLFTVVHRLSLSPDDSDCVTAELNAFLTAEALVTVHSTPCSAAASHRSARSTRRCPMTGGSTPNTRCSSRHSIRPSCRTGAPTT